MGMDLAAKKREVEVYRQETVQDPGNAMAWVKLGATLQEMDHYKPDGGQHVLETVNAYRTALDLGLPPALAISIYGNLGSTLMGADHSDKAITALDAGIELAESAGLDVSEASGLYYNRGKAYGYLGKSAEATMSYELAVQVARGKNPHIYALAATSLKNVDPDTLEDMENAARYLEGNLDNLVGKKDKAKERRHRQKGRDGGAASQSLVDSLRWLDSMTPVDRAYLHMGLYAGYKKQGDLDRAWEHLEKGNALYHATMPGYSLAGDMQLMQMLMSVFRGHFGGGGYMDRTPAFVVGTPRSGSTLVEQILASHSKVWGAGENTAMAPLIGEMMRKTSQASAQEQLQLMVEFGARYVETMRKRLPPGLEHAERIVDKMLRNLWNVGHIHMMLPQACIIYVVRHPLDTALSCYEQPFEGRGPPWAWDLGQIGEYILMNHAMARHWDSVLPGKLLTVMYEELVGNQEAVSRRILAHCGLEWEDNVMQFHRLQRGVQTASLDQVRQRMYNSSVFRYRQYEDKLAPLSEKLGPLVADYERNLATAIAASEGPGTGDTVVDGAWEDDEEGDEGQHSEL